MQGPEGALVVLFSPAPCQGNVSSGAWLSAKRAKVGCLLVRASTRMRSVGGKHSQMSLSTAAESVRREGGAVLVLEEAMMMWVVLVLAQGRERLDPGGLSRRGGWMSVR